MGHIKKLLILLFLVSPVYAVDPVYDFFMQNPETFRADYTISTNTVVALSTNTAGVFLRIDGSTPLTADWNAGAYKVTLSSISSAGDLDLIPEGGNYAFRFGSTEGVPSIKIVKTIGQIAFASDQPEVGIYLFNDISGYLLIKSSSDEQNIIATNSLNIITNGDTDDYLELSTPSGIPVITVQGGDELRFMSSNANQVTSTLYRSGTEFLKLAHNDTFGFSSMYATGSLNIYTNSETNDYLAIDTAADQTTLIWVGQNGRITASGGTIDFDDENLTTTGNLTGASLDTGQGANELYAMDQDVQTTDTPTFSSMTITYGISAGSATIINNLGIGTTPSAYPLDIVGHAGLGIGLRFGSVTTDATSKAGGSALRHYTNAEEDISLLAASSLAGSTNLFWGGGAGLNAATAHYFYTAANNTTLSGSPRYLIDSSGNHNFYSGTITTLSDITGAEVHTSTITARTGDPRVDITTTTLITDDLQLILRSTHSYIYSNADKELTIAGTVLTTVGTPGHIIIGTTTLNDMYPYEDLKINFGRSNKRFNEGHINEIWVSTINPTASIERIVISTPTYTVEYSSTPKLYTNEIYWGDGTIQVSSPTADGGITDHTLLTSTGTNTHAEIDTQLSALDTSTTTLEGRVDDLETSNYVSITATTTFSNSSASERDIFDEDNWTGYGGYGYDNNVTENGITYTKTNGRFQVDDAGIYSITGTWIMTASVSGIIDVIIQHDGDDIYQHGYYIHTTVDPAVMTVTIIAQLAANDYINFRAVGRASESLTFYAGCTATINKISGL